MEWTAADLPDVFVLANDRGWTEAELATLREGLELVRPVPEESVRLVAAGEDDATSRLQVGLGEGLELFLDLAGADLADRVVEPLKRFLAHHARDAGLDAHRVAVTGLHRDVEVLVVVEDDDPDEVARALERWPGVLELVDGIVDQHGPDQVRYVDVTWEPVVGAWVVRETMLAAGEVLPGPVFESTAP